MRLFHHDVLWGRGSARVAGKAADPVLGKAKRPNRGPCSADLFFRSAASGHGLGEEPYLGKQVRFTRLLLDLSGENPLTRPALTG